MRIHSDVLTSTDIHQAALIARVDYGREGRFTIHGSRSRARAFNVLLSGESRRRPNRGTSADRYNPEYAATWDQWGVFLAALYYRDPAMVTPYYVDADDFHYQTNGRFGSRDKSVVVGDPADFTNRDFWPADAHGDHTFRFEGVPFENKCTKCAAIRRWAPRV